jgi:hypothetical protein
MNPMKKIFTILILLITAQSFAQIETALIGEWKAIAIKNDSFFYHSQNDSITFNPNAKVEEKDKSMFKSGMKASLSSKKYFFKVDNEFILKNSPTEEVILTYEVLKETKVINLYEKNKNQAPIGKIEYFSRNGSLELQMTISGQKNSFMILNKVN